MPSYYCAFIRHGDYHQLANTPSALQPFALTENGEAQAMRGANELAELLNKYNLTIDPAVDSSNLLRAWQTANIFSQALAKYFPNSANIIGFDALAERSVGSAANLPIEQIEAILAKDPRFSAPPKNWKSDSHYCLPLQGAESLLDAGARVKGHLENWLNGAPQPNKLKLVFGHGAAFRHAAYHLNVLTFENIAALSMYHARPILFKVENGRFSHIDGQWKVRQQADLVLD